MQQDTIAAVSRRPLLISFLAFLLAIQGIVTLVVGIFAILNLASFVDTLSVQGHIVTRPVIDILGYVLGGMSAAIGIVIITLSIGLWNLQRWAFWAAIGLLVVNFAIQLALFLRPHTQTYLEIASLVISALLLLYFLLVPKVRKAFLRPKPTSYRRA